MSRGCRTRPWRGRTSGRTGTGALPRARTARRCIRSGAARTYRRSRAAPPWAAPPRPTGSRRGWRRFLRDFKVQGISYLQCQGRSRTHPAQAMRRFAQNKPSKSGKFFESFDAKRPGAKASGAKSLVHLSHLVRSGQLECYQLVHCKQAASKSSENLPERRPSSGEVDLPASTEPPRCCKKGASGYECVSRRYVSRGCSSRGALFWGCFAGMKKDARWAPWEM